MEFNHRFEFMTSFDSASLLGVALTTVLQHWDAISSCMIATQGGANFPSLGISISIAVMLEVAWR